MTVMVKLKLTVIKMETGLVKLKVKLKVIY